MSLWFLEKFLDLYCVIQLLPSLLWYSKFLHSRLLFHFVFMLLDFGLVNLCQSLSWFIRNFILKSNKALEVIECRFKVTNNQNFKIKIWTTNQSKMCAYSIFWIRFESLLCILASILSDFWLDPHLKFDYEFYGCISDFFKLTVIIRIHMKDAFQLTELYPSLDRSHELIFFIKI